MKLILLLSALLTITPVFAKDFLTESQADQVLEAIDNICGDSWCEGDYNYSFNEFSCDAETKSCSLTFEYISYIFDEETYDVIGEERYEAQCSLGNLSKFDDMTEINRDYRELTQEFYEQVGECIDFHYNDAPEIY